MMRRRSSRVTASRRRRARNPRTGARTEPAREAAVALAPLEEVLAVSRDALANSRAMIESVGTEAEEDAAMKGFMLRMIAQLDALCERAQDSDDDFQIFSLAWLTFAMALELDWLDADRKMFNPGLSQQQMDHVERLRRKRPAWDSGATGESAGGRWDGLVELISEAVEVFGRFRYWEGVRGCLELHEELERQSGS